jgi:hypothetical protein
MHCIGDVFDSTPGVGFGLTIYELRVLVFNFVERFGAVGYKTCLGGNGCVSSLNDIPGQLSAGRITCR